MAASYLKLYLSGELALRAREVRARLEECALCPRGCRARRLQGEVEECRTGGPAAVFSFGPHFGEESPLVGHGGSGTIFFTHCNLRCLYCQNYTISQKGEGAEVEARELAAMMLDLQRRGCHNINLVTPSHVVPQILEALAIAADAGLSVPLVYNTGGYDSVATLRLLDGVVDIYMPDMKYSDAAIAQELSGIESYPAANRAAVKEMHRQVGDLMLDERGVAVRGLLVRHLVLPGGLAGTEEAARFLAQKISVNTYLNVMDQYHPAHRAYLRPLLSHPLRSDEFQSALETVRGYGLKRLDQRPARRLALSL